MPQLLGVIFNKWAIQCYFKLARIQEFLDILQGGGMIM